MPENYNWGLKDNEFVTISNEEKRLARQLNRKEKQKDERQNLCQRRERDKLVNKKLKNPKLRYSFDHGRNSKSGQ